MPTMSAIDAHRLSIKAAAAIAEISSRRGNSGKKGQEMRSRNPVVDMWLLETDGTDNYDDLEDFLVFEDDDGGEHDVQEEEEDEEEEEED